MPPKPGEDEKNRPNLDSPDPYPTPLVLRVLLRLILPAPSGSGAPVLWMMVYRGTGKSLDYSGSSKDVIVESGRRVPGTVRRLCARARGCGSGSRVVPTYSTMIPSCLQFRVSCLF